MTNPNPGIRPSNLVTLGRYEVQRMSEIEAEIPLFPAFRGASMLDPPEAMLDLLTESPVSRVRLWNGQTPWIVTRYEDVRAVLRSPAFSSDTRKDGFPVVDPALLHFTEGILTHMDPPDHDVYRRMLAPEFMVKRMERLRPKIRDVVDERIDAMLEVGPPADLVQSLALPVPLMVTCDLLGVPFEDRDYFFSLADAFLGGRHSPEESERLLREYRDYIADLIDKKIENPTDDVLGYMASTHVVTGDLSREAMIIIVQLLVIAGFDTTMSMIGLGVVTLLAHPVQMAMLREDPSLVPDAVEELLRYLSITHRGLHRVAVEDVEVGGQLIRAGEGVIAAANIANRDPEVFENPNEFDIRRNALSHLAFGQGIHRCLGAVLARVELQVVYEAILERFPDIYLAESPSRDDYRDKEIVYGIRHLVVGWDSLRADSSVSEGSYD
jgi:cytochrome P450